jgi:hypothetical protein
MSTKNNAIQKAVIVPSVQPFAPHDRRVVPACETQKQKSQTFVTKQIRIDLL